MKKIITFNVIVFLVFVISIVYYISLYNDISKNLVRLHVISNSNSSEDIGVKFMVRDNILDDVREKINISSKRRFSTDN